jgi:hypothetical protein
MSRQLTEADARQSLNAHVASKGAELCAQYGPELAWKDLPRLLADPAFVRYPCELVFDAAPLEPGEFAHPVPRGDSPQAGFQLCIHPFFMTDLDRVPALALYQLVLINYGDFASAEDAETFGAAALGIEPDAYYQRLCQAADDLG